MINSPVSDEELQLKKRARRRLVGAIVLVLLAVVLLPLVLEKEPKPVAQDISIQIPPQDTSGTFNSKIVSIADPASGVNATQGVQNPVAVAPKLNAQPPSPVTNNPVPVEPIKPQTTPPVEAKPKQIDVNQDTLKKAEPAKTKAPEKGFVVQLATFAEPENAKQLQAKLTGLGIKSYTEILKTPKGNRTRVRAGPFASRQAAEETRDKLKAKGMQGIVTSAK